MDKFENYATHNIGETCCASISLDDLKALSEDKQAAIIPFGAKMVYGDIPGLKSLRVNLANLYSSKIGTATEVTGNS
jgi:hypothetical protein